jgi:hypothetical protein
MDRLTAASGAMGIGHGIDTSPSFLALADRRGTFIKRITRRSWAHMRSIPKIFLMLALFSLTTVMILRPSFAGAGDLTLHGFLQGNYTLNIDGENPDGGDLKWSEERVQLKLNGSRDSIYLSIKADIYYDHIKEEADLDLREGYLDYISVNWDMRAGRQIITWGIGDLIFVNDVFPKDYEAFYAGRPLEYLKKGVDAVKIGLYPQTVNIEFVVIPFFEPNTLPGKEQFHNSMNPDADDPAEGHENIETALRAYRNIGGYEVALYFYRGFSRMPSMASGGRFFYPELSVYGASIEGRALSGILGFEAGYYDSREDRDGDDPTIPNSSTRALALYKKQLMEDFTIGLQYYVEYMHEYSEYETALLAGYAREDRLYQLSTLRLTSFLMHQNLRLSLFIFYSPSDDDSLLNPEVKYKFTDNIWAAVGGNVFDGNTNGRFGQLHKNDNAYFQMRYEF